MASICPLSRGGGFHGPPPPLILVPIVVQLVRSGRDPKILAFLKELSRGGPVAIAENAHKIAQYALSKLPPSVLYWFASSVLNLAPEVAMQTTEFLKSRTELEAAAPADQQPRTLEIVPQSTPVLVPSEIERRLEKLELDYQVLQAKHNESARLLSYQPEKVHLLREPPLPLVSQPAREQVETAVDSMQLVEVKSPENTSPPPSTSADARALLQDVGIRLGRIVLEWAGDTMKQTIVNAASRSSGNQVFVEAGVDLAGRFVDAIVT